MIIADIDPLSLIDQYKCPVNNTGQQFFKKKLGAGTKFAGPYRIQHANHEYAIRVSLSHHVFEKIAFLRAGCGKKWLS